LAFYDKKNILLNIECKDILPPYCLKDSKSLRNDIFGKDNKDRGYLGKVEAREKYINENIEKIFSLMNWSLNLNIIPEIKSIFVSRYKYWWTKFPPVETKVVFLRVDMLTNFLNKI